MSVNRIHRSDKFVQVPNDTVRDERLSFKARGLLVYMLSHADGWKADYKVLARSGKEGQEAVRSGLRELDALGYRIVVRERGERGKFNTVVHWFDTPGHVSPESGSPLLGNPEPGQPERNRRPSQKTMKKSAPSSSSSSLRSSDSSSVASASALNWPIYK